MSVPLIECVPNISEARREHVIDRLADEVRGIEGVSLLDRSSDVSHNRSVFTIAGTAAALSDAVLGLVSVALETIDLRVHDGVHPRVGAVDVVPFVPLTNATMADCVDLARRVGRQIADRFGVPVYLYEHAAVDPARRRLPDIRRGEFEGLAAKMSRPEWRPDFGPAHPHATAGATVVGAREILVAYNVNLATGRLEVARRIASLIRERDGGLPGVRALGLSLPHRGIVQVSMNLVDHRTTALRVVFDRIAAEAAREGVDVLESEIVGLVPSAALAGTTPGHLRLSGFSADQVLEERLRAAGFQV